jgi:hypothetical protein
MIASHMKRPGLDRGLDLVPALYREAVARALGCAGKRKREWTSAIQRAPAAHREAFAFLLAHMPQPDLRGLSGDYVLSNLDLAFRVQDEVPCSMVVPRELFLNYVVPYAQINERRDPWRSEFFARFAETARRSASIQDAVLTLNQMVFEQLAVRYNPERAPQRVLSPKQAVASAWAGPWSLSIMLANACRAVGIPARLVTAHPTPPDAEPLCWVEVWDHGKWHLVAAGIQGTYDVAWFNDKIRITAKSRNNLRIYAASYLRTGTAFPCGTDDDSHLPDAVDISDTYGDLARTPLGVEAPVCRPKHYVCCRAQGPVPIDGRLDRPVWRRAPWTDYFVDIEGHRKPPPRFLTRAKLLWDDDFLYVGAELEEPHVWGTLKQRNEIIFNDNDFEIFIDPDGDNHHYYEFEVNALNTIWELTLERPYRDGGPIHRGTNLPGLKSAVHIRGTLNDPSDTDQGWSVTVAIPWVELKRYARASACPPCPGDQWRMNFSRVEWLVEIINGAYRKVAREAHPEDNWVWSPQGAIDMHRPEVWGYVRFETRAANNARDDDHYDPGWLARQILMEVYYRQRLRKLPALKLNDLGLKPTRHPTLLGSVKIMTVAGGWEARQKVIGSDGRIRTLHVSADARLWETGPTNRQS